MTTRPQRRNPRAAVGAVMAVVAVSIGAVVAVAPAVGESLPWAWGIPDITVEVSALTAPWSTSAEARRTYVTVTSSDPEPVTLVIRHDGRDILTFDQVPSGEAVDFWISKNYAEGEWTASATSGGSSVSSVIPVAIRWAPMADLRSGFDPCGTVGWFAESEGAPEGVTGLEQDIRSVLGQLEGATGLNFTRVESRDEADLIYSWVAGAREGNPGTGGHRITAAGTYQGFVQLNSNTSWVTRPGTLDVGGEPGRGVLLLHETGHALGLGHVGDVTQVMNTQADAGGPTELAAGDRAGLAWIYQPETCTDRNK